MSAGVRDASVTADFAEAEAFDADFRDLRRNTEPDGPSAGCISRRDAVPG